MKTEMQSVLQMISKLPKNVLIKNPSGSYSFVGRVDVRLCYQRRDGLPLTAADASDIQQFGAGFLSHVESRSFPTEELARIAEKEILNSIEVVNK